MSFLVTAIGQSKPPVVELFNYSKVKLSKAVGFADAKLSGTKLSAQVRDGQAVLQKDFIICKVRNRKSNLPNFIILPEKLVNKTSKINMGSLMSKKGQYGIRIQPGPLSVITCYQCSDENASVCSPTSEDRKDGRKNVYCSGCCGRSGVMANSLAIPA